MSNRQVKVFQRFMIKLCQFFTYWLSYPVLRFFLHFEVKGQEHLKGLEKGPIIFASNHASYIDGPISGASLPRSSLWPGEFAPLRFLVIDRFFRWKYFPINLFLRLNGAIKIIRSRKRYPDGRHLEKTLAEAIEALRKGEKVWIYPEGGLTKDGKLQKGRKGVVYLHKQTRAPIVPVAIVGNYGVLSFRSLLRKNRLRVNIGRPIKSLECDSLEEGVRVVMNAISTLMRDANKENDIEG